MLVSGVSGEGVTELLRAAFTQVRIRRGDALEEIEDDEATSRRPPGAGSPDVALRGALTRAKRIVFKVGSALLVDAATGAADRAWLDAFCRRRRPAAGPGPAGAGGVVRRRGPGPPPPGPDGRKSLTLPEKQAAAAAGQSVLMRAWEEALEPHGVGAAQILLTRDDTETRRRWLNARATVETLIALERRARWSTRTTPW